MGYVCLNILIPKMNLLIIVKSFFFLIHGELYFCLYFHKLSNHKAKYCLFIHNRNFGQKYMENMHKC